MAFDAVANCVAAFLVYGKRSRAACKRVRPLQGGSARAKFSALRSCCKGCTRSGRCALLLLFSLRDLVHHTRVSEGGQGFFVATFAVTTSAGVVAQEGGRSWLLLPTEFGSRKPQRKLARELAFSRLICYFCVIV